MQWRVRRPHAWGLLVPVLFALAGVLLATSARVSRGTDLRAGARTDLAQLIGAQEQRLAQQSRAVTRLRSDVAQRTRKSGAGELTATQAHVDALAAAAGMQAENGPGVRVVLADSPYHLGDPQLPLETQPDDLVVHQQDLQAVVNALWRGGATAIGVMDQRLISTSAVRCAGNVLILQGHTYAPPFVVTAIGVPSRLQTALRDEPAVRTYAQYAQLLGLRYDVSNESSASVAAYDGPLTLDHASPVTVASVGPSAGPTS